MSYSWRKWTRHHNIRLACNGYDSTFIMVACAHTGNACGFWNFLNWINLQHRCELKKFKSRVLCDSNDAIKCIKSLLRNQLRSPSCECEYVQTILDQGKPDQTTAQNFERRAAFYDKRKLFAFFQNILIFTNQSEALGEILMFYNYRRLVYRWQAYYIWMHGAHIWILLHI